MKVKISIVLLFLLAIPLTTEAKFSKYIGVGLNRSSFRTEECKSLIGASIELGLDYYPVKSFGAFIGSGIIYLNRRSFIENRTLASSYVPKESKYLNICEIKVNISYLEIPLHIGYSVKIQDNLIFRIFSGYSLSLPIVDHSKLKLKIVRELTSDEKGKYDFDYHLVDELGVGWSNSYLIGCRTSYYQYNLIISYLRALYATESISDISLQDKIDTLKISVAYKF